MNLSEFKLLPVALFADGNEQALRFQLYTSDKLCINNVTEIQVKGFVRSCLIGTTQFAFQICNAVITWFAIYSMLFLKRKVMGMF